MRLREPFQGYKLSSGHFMFHMAYLVGSQFAVRCVLDEDAFDQNPGSDSVLFQLNLAHFFTPLLNLFSLICDHYEYHVLEKIFDTVSIFQYQGTIFYAQFF